MKKKSLHDKELEEKQKEADKAVQKICQFLGGDLNSVGATLTREWSQKTLTQFGYAIPVLPKIIMAYEKEKNKLQASVPALSAEEFNTKLHNKMRNQNDIIIKDGQKFEAFVEKFKTLNGGSNDPAAIGAFLKEFSDELIAIQPAQIFENTFLNKHTGEFTTTLAEAKGEACRIYNELKTHIKQNVTPDTPTVLVLGDWHDMPASFMAAQMVLHIAHDLDIQCIVHEYSPEDLDDIKKDAEKNSEAPVAVGAIAENLHIHRAKFYKKAKDLGFEVIAGDVPYEEKHGEIRQSLDSITAKSTIAAVEAMKEQVIQRRNESLVNATPPNQSSIIMVGGNHLEDLNARLQDRPKVLIHIGSLSRNYRERDPEEDKLYTTEVDFCKNHCFNVSSTRDLDRLTPHQTEECVTYAVGRALSASLAQIRTEFEASKKTFEAFEQSKTLNPNPEMKRVSYGKAENRGKGWEI